MTQRLLTIARLELTTCVRRRWIQLFAAAFALLTLGTAYASGAAQDLGAADGFARTTVGMVPLVMLLVPLLGLLLGISTQSGDAGTDTFLYAQPVARFEVVVGRWLGQATAAAGCVFCGFGSAAALLATNSGPEGLPGFAFFTLISAVLAIVFLSIAAVIAAIAPNRAMSLGIALFVWFVFALLYDAAALSTAMWWSGRTGARALFVSVFGNPADLARVLILSVSGTPHVLGAAEDGWYRFLGGPVTAALVSSLALTAWALTPLLVAIRVTARREV